MICRDEQIGRRLHQRAVSLKRQAFAQRQDRYSQRLAAYRQYRRSRRKSVQPVSGATGFIACGYRRKIVHAGLARVGDNNRRAAVVRLLDAQTPDGGLLLQDHWRQSGRHRHCLARRGWCQSRRRPAQSIRASMGDGPPAEILTAESRRKLAERPQIFVTGPTSRDHGDITARGLKRRGCA